MSFFEPIDPVASTEVGPDDETIGVDGAPKPPEPLEGQDPSGSD